MKKIFAILLTLLMVLCLPVAVLADEAVSSADSPTEDVATVGGVETSDVETSVEATTNTEASETEGAKTTFGFFPATLAETLPVMGMGMLGIFLVTCVIILAVLVLSKLGKGKDEE